MMVFALLCWGVEPAHPAHRRRRARPEDRSATSLARPARCCSHLRDDRRLWWGALVTSWFWLVGAVVLSLLPPLVKTVLGGTEEVVTAYLAIFSIAIAVGSGLAAWLAAGRIVLLPTLIGAVAARRCSRSISAGRPTARRSRSRRPASARCSRSGRGIRVAIDLAGLAIAGGLFIVPTFAAVQAWAGADRRARVIAGVNVLNAAFMVGGTVVVAVLQAFGVDDAAAVHPDRRREPRRRRSSIGRTMPANALRDFLSIMFRALYRVEVQGRREPRQGRAEPDHRAQPCQLPRRRRWRCRCCDKEPVFAIDSAHRAALVGEAVPQASRARCRSIRPSRWRRAR